VASRIQGAALTAICRPKQSLLAKESLDPAQEYQAGRLASSSCLAVSNQRLQSDVVRTLQDAVQGDSFTTST